MTTKYSEDFANAEVKQESPHTGYYCEWGAYHEAYYGKPCTHWQQTGVPPWYMVKKRKELFQKWADGKEGRPPRWYNGNAMTRAMQNAIVQFWNKEKGL